MKAIYAQYALNAVALLPHMVFLVDFVARGLGRGLEIGAHYWVVFGIGAVVGPIATGHLADRIGFAHALRLALVVQTVAVALPALVVGSAWLVVSSLVVGAMVPGIVPLVLGRVHELAPTDDSGRTAAWSFATIAFPLGQAGAAYGFSFLFARAGDGYATLFGLGAARPGARSGDRSQCGRARWRKPRRSAATSAFDHKWYLTPERVIDGYQP